MNDRVDAFGQAFQSVSREHGFEPIVVEGALPPALRGTVWRNGPGLFEVFGRPYVHWFDADGLATAVRIADGRAQLACRVVECPRLAQERAAGRALFASGQTRAAWHRMVGGRGKAVRNINIMPWGDRVLALAEGGLPIPLDPQTLASSAPIALAPKQPSFHAHYRVDPRTGVRYGFGMRYGKTGGLDVYRVGRDSAERIAAIELPASRILVHDVAFAGDALIFVIHPMGVRILPLMLGLKSPFECLDWQPEAGSEVIIVPLADPTAVRRFSIPAFFHFHFGNAFRDGDAWQIDLAHMPDLDLAQAFGLDALRAGDLPPDPTRFGRMTLRGEQVEWRALDATQCEFPTVDPRRAGQRHRYTWVVAGAHATGGLLRLDHETGDRVRAPLPESWFLGEATLVPYGPAEDAVWALSQFYDSARNESGLVVIDGARPAEAPLATLWFGQRVPPALHGCFVPA